MTPPTLRPRGRQTIEWSVALQTAAKTAAAVVGILYGIGLIVSAIHLNSYGVVYLALAKPQYILTGSWFVAPLLCGMTSVLVGADLWRGRNTLAMSSPVKSWMPAKILKLQTILMIIWLAFLIGSAPFVALTAIILTTFDAPWFNPDFGGCVTVAAGAVAVMLLFLFRGITGAARSVRFVRTSIAPPGLGYLFASVSGGVFLLLLYLLFFVIVMFPRIPSAVGGGQPRRVSLVLRTGVVIPPLPLEKRGAITVPVWLLVETDKTYVLLLKLKDTKTLSVSRDDVVAVLGR